MAYDLLLSADTCLVYENQAAMKREITNCQEGRDIWWQVSMRYTLSNLNSHETRLIVFVMHIVHF